MVVAFDVNETLSDMRGIARQLEQLGAPPGCFDVWFAQTLRDGFALTAAGAYADFASVATPLLTALLEEAPGLRGSPEESSRQVIAGLAELDLHPDVEPALRHLAARGSRVVTLGNGAARVAETLLQRAGIHDLVEQFLSVTDVGRWKPHPDAYRHALERCNVEPHEMMLIAAHPWDIDGARRAGLRAGWVARSGGAYPPYFQPPDIRGRDLSQLVLALDRST
jgi:2-haloacid dehalogenase